jgi:hypothetical protein
MQRMNLKSFFFIDWKDKWNWILLALALLLFWWGVRGILYALKNPVP